MGTATAKSSQITNRDASPRVLSNSYLAGAAVKHCRGVCAITNGDTSPSTYRFCTIPSNALVISVRKTHPDIGTTTTMDIGLYKTTADGGAVVDADAFTAATVLNAGAVTKGELVAGNLASAANGEKRVWELLGLSADPKISYDVTGTLVGAADAAGSVLIEVDYVI